MSVQFYTSFIQALAFVVLYWHGTKKPLRAHYRGYHFHKGEAHFTCSNTIICQMQMPLVVSW